MSLHFLFLIVALILALLATFNVPARISLLAAAFASFIVSLLVSGSIPG